MPVRVILAIVATALLLVLYIEKINQLTTLRLQLPQLEKNLKELEEENKRLKFEIGQFESPLYLMELLKKPEFSHLKFPQANEVEKR
jgi:cell division protein FtsB